MPIEQTKLTLEYINRFFESKKIEIPKDIDLGSIFIKYDKFDDQGKAVKGGDGFLQDNEAKSFWKELYSKSSKLGEAFLQCVKEYRIEQKKEERLANPPDAHSFMLDDDCLNYLFDKLETLGIEQENIDMELLAGVIKSFDFTTDKNSDSRISPKEAEAAEKEKNIILPMNKNSKGKTVETHILDLMINKYINKKSTIDYLMNDNT